MKTDIPMKGSMDKKTTSHLKTRFEYSALRRTSFPLWFQACQRVRLQDLIRQLQGHFQDKRVIVQHLLQACLHHRRQHEGRLRLEKERIELKVTSLQKKTNKTEPQKERRDPLLEERGDPLYSEIPEWLQEFNENLVDDEIPEHGDSHASSSHEASLEPIDMRREDLGKHSVQLISRKTEFARSVGGRKLQGPREEDAMAEPYLVQKFLVT